MRHNVSRASRFAGAASVLTLASLLASSPAHAAAPAGTDQFQHFIDCAQWLISDPSKHAKFCDPGTTVFVTSGGDGTFHDQNPE